MATSTLSRMMKKAASVIPLANRRTPSRRNYTSAPLKTGTIVSASNRPTNNLLGKVIRTPSIPAAHHHFSALAEKRSDSDDTLLSVLESVIDRAEEKVHKVAKTPKEFPFKIEDNPWEVLKMSREYQGEEIKISVSWPKEYGFHVEFSAIVSKKSGPTLDFYGEANRNGGIRIYWLTVKNPNTSGDCINFADVEEKLQEAIYTYLEIRGFEPSIGSFLYDSMVQNDRRVYAGWLKNVKNFIAN